MNRCEGSLSLPALPDYFFDFEFAECFAVEALGEGDYESISFGPDEFVVEELDEPAGVPRSFFGDETDIELCEQFFAGFLEAYLLVEDESAVFAGGDFLGEGKCGLLYDHPAGELHLHFDGEEGEHEVKGLLFFLSAHFQHRCDRLTLYK